MGYTQRHMNNLGRLVGHKVGSGLSTYQYILNTDDLTNAYLQLHDELGYPLQIDSRYRRAIVYNKKGLEKRIQDMINDTIEAAAKNLSDIVVADITNQLNNITMAANGKFVVGGGKSFNLGGMLGHALGKGLVDGFFTIIDEITDNDDDYRRR